MSSTPREGRTGYEEDEEDEEEVNLFAVGL